tara:strand:+ start:1548 stop:2045 length:498 start_codon:yes stop_codon:yes gene_type:complete
VVNLTNKLIEVEADMSNEMTKEQADLFESMTGLQQRISTHVLSGMKPSDAHREAGGTCNNEGHRRNLATQILSNPTVKAFLESFSYRYINEAIMTRDTMMETLSSLSHISESELSEMTVEKLAGLKDGMAIKLKSMDQLSKLAGYNEAQKVDNTHRIIDSGDSQW